MSSYDGTTLPGRARTWLLATGALVLALALVFALLGLLIPVVRVGFVPAAIAIGAAGLVLVVLGQRAGARADAAARVLRTGLDGRATVLAISQTGVLVNYMPQVEMRLSVEVAGRSPHPLTLKTVVPQVLLSRVTSGTPLAVKVDPADPGNVQIDWRAPANSAIAAPPGPAS